MITDDFINSFNLISHTEPNRKLILHLNEVYKKAKDRFDKLNINFENLSISKDEFELILKITTLCHDFGKSSTFFQYKLFKDKLTKNEKNLSEHGLISAFFGYFIAIEKFKLNKRLVSFIFMAIRHHHLDLENSQDMQLIEKLYIGKVLNIFNGIKQNSDEVDKIYNYFFGFESITFEFEEFLNNSFPKNEFKYLKNYFRYKKEYKNNDIFIFMLTFSLLIYADKQDAIFRDDEILTINNLTIDSNKLEEFKIEYFKTKDKTPLDEIREKIYKSIIKEFENIQDKKLFFIKLPTGAGKTLLLYKLAMLIKEQQIHQKVFYLLPFITLIEQNANILKELLEFMNIDTSNSKIFLEKHSLSSEFLIKDKNRESEEYDIDKSQFLFDTLDSEFVVTSFHQLFYGIFKRKNSLLKRFHQFANSVILIDEIQLIPLNLMYTVSQFLKFMSEIFNCKIIVASATFPNINENILSGSYTFDSIDEILSKDKIDKFFNRYEIKVDLSKAYSLKEIENSEDLREKIDEKLKTKKDLLFRVNTVNSANDIYDYIISVKSEYDIENIFLLTSAIPPINRKIIIEKIKNNSKIGVRQIVVATQLIQAGVDISLEDGFEELAPLDLIIQSMGRRNRSGEKLNIGKADIIKIKNHSSVYGHAIYNKVDIRESEEILSNYEFLSEKEIYNKKLLDRYYNSQVEIRDIDEEFKYFNFKNIDEKFVLIANVLISFSFFIPMDSKAKELWRKLKELDKEKKEIKKDRYFWQNMKKIKNEYSKIKKAISLYIVNQNFYYQNSKKEIVVNLINDKFDKALGIYLASEDIFDNQKGLQINKYIKNKIEEMEGLFW